MRYGSVCSGIEAATAAWHHMGWEPAFFSEIEAFPRAVLEHHYPEVPLHGDFTTIEENQYGKIDLLVGGTPCQSFSIAGLRGGLDDERGNLALEFCRLAQREQPRWIVWENVPGVLSSNGGRDFGSILGALEELGYGLAYRVLDAQYFGVAQRRRRVFVVGYLGDWRRAAAVLFERHSMSGRPAPSREARKEPARDAAVSTYECGGIGRYNTGDVSSPLLRSGADKGHGCEALIARGDGPDLTGPLTAGMHKGPRGTEGVDSNHIVPVPQPIMAGGPVGGNQGGDYVVAFSAKDHGGDATEELSPTLRAGGHSGSHANAGVMPAVAYPINSDADRANCSALTPSPDAEGRVRLRDPGLGVGKDGDPMYTLQATKPHAVAFHNRQDPDVSGGVTHPIGAKDNGLGVFCGAAVRRLTPVECERLQGFPDNFTAIPWRKKDAANCPDGPRYKALGNSMAVPVMRWIGERIQLVDDLTSLL